MSLGSSRLRRRGATVVACLTVLSAMALHGPAAAAPVRPAAPAAPASPPEGSIPDLAAMGWVPVLDENFTGTTLDESVWNVVQSQHYIDGGIASRDAVSVSGGNLRLSNYTDAAGKHHGGGIETGGIGALTPTSGGFQGAYGYAEARMLFPDGPDTTSTFWTMSNNGNNSMPFGDPAGDGPELDIVEHGNKPGSGPGSGDANGDGKCDWPSTATLPCKEAYLAGGHWDGFEEDHKPMHYAPVENPTPANSLQGNFHTFGMLWTPEEYRFFLDGVEVKRVTAGTSYSPEWYILRSYVTQSSTTNFGPLGHADNDVTLVDYVKVWQRPLSDVPNQATAATTPLAVPFTVTDYAYGALAKAEPGTVTVTATSSNTTVVPNSGLVVSGNGPADPDGSFTNGGFESGTTGWALTGSASVWTTKKHTGTQALRLTEAGGRATQTITGLRPNTTYLVGGHHEIDLAYNDANGNGRVDIGETFTDPGNRTGQFDWGISNVDSAAVPPREVKTIYARNGWTEDDIPTWWGRDPFPHEYLKFTTGPTTTSVTMYLDNVAYVGTQNASDVTFDSFYVLPVVAPQRTLSIRPADGQVGDTTVTLTAKNAAGTTLGTDTFTLTVGVGSLRDGGFEAGTATTPWELLGGSKIVALAPFKVDRELQMGKVQPDTVVQNVKNLDANSRYRLEVTGRNAQAAGDFTLAVQNHGGSQVTGVLNGTATSTQSIEFVTGAANTTADVLLLDWDTTDGEAYVEKVKLAKCTTTTSCAAVVTSVASGPPADLATVGTQYGVSSRPLNITAHLPAGATFSSATSTNKVLVPDANIASTGSGRRRAFSVTPIADRTGKTSIRVAYTGASGSPVDIPVVISDAALLQPGFEKGTLHWTTSGTAAVITTGQHGGTKAMQINGAGEIKQAAPGLPHATGYYLSGWVDGSAAVTVRTVPVGTGDQSEVLATATWTGTGWSEKKLPFTTLQCTDCIPEAWRPVEVVITDANTGDGLPVKVDDLALVHAPVIRRMRDISIHTGQTAFDWTTRRTTAVGRIPENGLWDPAVRSVATADIPGFGTGVVPLANVDGPKLGDSGWPFSWWFDVKMGTKTGRSKVTLTLTDQATGNTTAKSYAVTVNAGNNFNNGDFERSSLDDSGINTGWGPGWLSNSFSIEKRQGWQFLGEHNSGWTYVGPRDDNKVLRISEGAAEHSITGLAPSTQYKVKLRAKGDGSKVQVKPYDDILSAPVLGQVLITPPNSDNVWRDYELTFTTNATGNGSTSVMLYLVDTTASGESTWECAIFATSETCFDDIGVFKASDVP